MNSGIWQVRVYVLVFFLITTASTEGRICLPIDIVCCVILSKAVDQIFLHTSSWNMPLKPKSVPRQDHTFKWRGGKIRSFVVFSILQLINWFRLKGP